MNNRYYIHCRRPDGALYDPIIWGPNVRAAFNDFLKTYLILEMEATHWSEVPEGGHNTIGLRKQAERMGRRIVNGVVYTGYMTDVALAAKFVQPEFKFDEATDIRNAFDTALARELEAKKTFNFSEKLKVNKTDEALIKANTHRVVTTTKAASEALKNAAMIVRDGPAKPKPKTKPPVSTAKPNPFGPRYRSPDIVGDPVVYGSAHLL